MKTEDCSPRHPRFKGCRSFTLLIFEDGEKTETNRRNSAAMALYQAGRVLEIAKTDKRAVRVEVWTHDMRVIFEGEAETL